MDLLRFVIAGAIAVAPSAALSRSNAIADAAAACYHDLQHPEAGPIEGARHESATAAPAPQPPPSTSVGAAEAAPTTLPSDDVPPILRAIQQSDEERRQQEVERAGGALFPAGHPTDGIGNASTVETATGQSAAVPPSVGSQIGPPPNALFVPLVPQRSAR